MSEPETDPASPRPEDTLVDDETSTSDALSEDDASFADLLRELALAPGAPLADGPSALFGSTRFALRRLLGQGTFGVVYEAFDSDRGAPVALKLLRRPDPVWLARFKLEFRGFAGLRHPHLVTLHELIAEGEQWLFTMELLRGEPLVAFLRRESEADWGKVRRAFAQLASGVAALHAAGKLHCDLKPSNVLVADGERVVILDFGLAVDLAAPHLGRSGGGEGVMGTPAYMAPEQAVGMEPTEASDWYAVGVMLFETLTGRLPVEGTGIDLLRRKQLLEEADPRSICPDLPGDLADLCAALTRRDPSARPSEEAILAALEAARSDGASARSRPSPTWAPPLLVGREREMAELDEAFREASARGASVVCVRGDSGIGKSALVHHFLEGLRDQGEACVLEGRCYELESVPYKALDGVVDRLATYLGGLDDTSAAALLPPDIARATQLFPALRQVRTIRRAAPRARPPDSLDMRAEGALSLRALLHNLAGGLPLVIAIDDLQWADAESGPLLLDLLAAKPSAPLLLIAMFRPEGEAAGPVRALRSLPRARDISVEALDAAQALALVETLVVGAPEVDAAKLAAESAGSPLFLRELVRAAREGEAGAGVSLAEMLARRIAKLPDDAERLLDTVAVAGRPTRLDVLERVADLGGYEAFAAAGVLRARGLVRTAGAHPDEQAETFHDRIRDCVLARLAPERRASLHGRLASAIERAGGADPETLAVHWAAAGERSRAGLFAERAGDAAASALAFEHAAQLFGWAIELSAPSGELHAPSSSLHEKQGDALANAGRHEGAAEAYLAAAIGLHGGVPKRLTRRAAEQLLRAGAIERGRGLLLRVVGSEPREATSVAPLSAHEVLRLGVVPHEAPMAAVDKARTLRRAPLFAGLLPEQLDVVAAIADELRYEPGQTVIQEGTPGDALFVVVDGSADIMKESKRLRALAQGDILGEVAALDGSPRTATAIATSPLTLLRIQRDELDILLDAYPELARGVIRTLLAYLR